MHTGIVSIQVGMIAVLRWIRSKWVLHGRGIATVTLPVGGRDWNMVCVKRLVILLTSGNTLDRSFSALMYTTSSLAELDNSRAIPLQSVLLLLSKEFSSCMITFSALDKRSKSLDD